MFHLAVQNKLLKAVFGQLAKKIEKNGEFDPKSYYSNDYKINSDQWVGMPKKITLLYFCQGGGSSKMITVLHFEGGGVPPNDYG